MKKTFLILIVTVSLGFANGPAKELPKLPLSITLPLLKGVKKDAIVFGKGEIDVYVFVDPMCPRSREFVDLIAENEKMKARYRYYFFFYELKRFKSQKIIESIYASEEPKKSMLDVMLHSKTIAQKSVLDSVKNKIKRIAAVAEKINVYKRPYLVLVKKGKK